MHVLGLALGGALGTLSRYGVGLVLQGALGGGAPAAFPLATLVVNVLGSFLLAVATGLGLRGVLSPAVALAVGTGFLGAFTTFSTFELESDLLWRDGRRVAATGFVLANLVLGYGAILAGRALAGSLAGDG